jgi:hypothetical protein
MIVGYTDNLIFIIQISLYNILKVVMKKLLKKMLTLSFVFPIFWLWVVIMKVILETRRAH